MSYSLIAAGNPVLALCNACALLALANNVITVRFVGFILERGTPRSGRFLANPPAG